MPRRFLLVSATGAIGFLLSLPQALAMPGDSWAMWQGGAGHTGYLPDTLLLSLRHFAWSENATPAAITGLAASNSMVFATDGIQYQPGGSSILVAQDLGDGHWVWSRVFPAGTQISAPAYADGMVFVTENVYPNSYSSPSRYLDTFNAATGTAIYRALLAPPGPTFDNPTIVGGHVYFESPVSAGGFSSSNSNVNVFGSASEMTGLLEWQSQTVQGDGWMPTVADGWIFGFGTQLNLLDPATGVTSSSIANPGDTTDPPSGRAPTVIGSAAYAIQGNKLVAFDLAAGKVAWTVDDNASGQIATDGRYLFYLSAGALSVRNAATGALMWGWEAPQPGPVSSGAVSDNLVITKTHVILTDGVKTYFINRATHLLDCSYSVAGLLGYAGDKLIIGDAQGNVTTFELPSDELFSSSFE